MTLIAPAYASGKWTGLQVVASTGHAPTGHWRSRDLPLGAPRDHLPLKLPAVTESRPDRR